MKIKSDYFPRDLSVMNNQWYLDTCLWLKQTKNIKSCAKFIFHSICRALYISLILDIMVVCGFGMILNNNESTRTLHFITLKNHFYDISDNKIKTLQWKNLPNISYFNWKQNIPQWHLHKGYNGWRNQYPNSPENKSLMPCDSYMIKVGDNINL